MKNKIRVRCDVPEHTVIDLTPLSEEFDDLTANKMDDPVQWSQWVDGVLTLWSHWLEEGTDA